MRLIGLIVFVAVAGCHPTPPPVRPDASDAATAAGTCAGVCQNGRRLHCDFALPTMDGVPCEDVCSNLQGSGIAAWNLACRSRATSCAAIDACR